MTRQTGLHKYPSTPSARTRNSRGLDQQRHGLLGRAISRCEEFLIEIKERNHFGLMHAMQRCLGTDDHSRSGSTGISSALRSEFCNRLTHKRFKLFANPIDSGAKVLHFRAPTSSAKHWSNGIATQTDKESVLSLHNGRFTSLARRDLAARNTRRQTRASLAIEDADHSCIAAEGVDKAIAEQTRTRRFVTTINNVKNGPPRSFCATRLGEQFTSIERFKRWSRAHQQAGHAASPRSFDENIARIPCWRLLLLERFVVFVDHDDCGWSREWSKGCGP